MTRTTGGSSARRSKSRSIKKSCACAATASRRTAMGSLSRSRKNMPAWSISAASRYQVWTRRRSCAAEKAPRRSARSAARSHGSSARTAPNRRCFSPMTARRSPVWTTRPCASRSTRTSAGAPRRSTCAAATTARRCCRRGRSSWSSSSPAPARCGSAAR